VTGERAGRLYIAYGAAIYARCLRLLGDPHAAEDATQETFLKAHRRLQENSDDPESFAWVYRVATNLCLTMIRDRKPQSDLKEELVGNQSIEEVLSNRDLVRRIVLQAPENHRLAAWLHYVEGLGLDETGKVLGVTPRTVTNWVTAFAQEARKLLGPVND
jgi:RNA polymerase sigma-70 factor, ECF subfamily